MLIKRKSLLVSLAMVVALLLVCGAGTGYAKVSGPCVNCHTMHNSQGGTPVVAGGPYGALLVNDCVGCHTGTNDGTNATPYVMSLTAPVFTVNGVGNTLAGGNFWWVAQAGGDAKGHNVLGISGQDAAITAAEGAPGGTIGGPGCTGCHGTLAVAQIELSAFGSGCEGCHLNVMHHADDGTGTKYVGASPWYRFLSGHASGFGSGVTGIEHVGWNYGATIGSANHNEYLGSVGDKTSAGGFAGLGNTMTAFCTGCHGNFHIQDSTATGAAPWLRHPSDAVIPNSGEYAFMSTLYNPDTPVARPANFAGWTTGTPSAAVAPGTDMVMCLSCHVAHGSPYDDLLRWDYAAMVAGTTDPGNTGCFVCHTTKDD